MIRILLVDDHEVMRDGLRVLLQDQSDMEVVGEAGHGRQALEVEASLHPDVVLMDVEMPELNGIEATRQLVARNAGVKVVALTMFTDQKVMQEMLDAGAVGFVVKGASTEHLIDAIHAAERGEVYLSPEIVGSTDTTFVEGARRHAALVADVLTNREKEVLQLVAEGGTTKSVGVRLHISAKTVDTHRQNIMKKLDIRTVAELTKYAVRRGLTSLQF